MKETLGIVHSIKFGIDILNIMVNYHYTLFSVFSTYTFRDVFYVINIIIHPQPMYIGSPYQGTEFSSNTTNVNIAKCVLVPT